MGIKDIARMSGVSISTVSRVLNGTKAVSPELERKVRETIARENYVPDHTARSMVLGRTNLIGLLLPQVSGIFHQRLFNLLETHLEEKGYKLIVCSIKDNDNSELSYLNLLQQKEVDGIILCHESYSENINNHINSSKIPVVQCAINIPELKWPAYYINPRKAVFDGVSLLTSLNHRKIGMICSNAFKESSKDPQVAGYRDALKNTGIPFNPDYLLPGSFSLDSGEKVTKELLQKHPELTALFYVNDEMAIGGYKTITSMGLKIGKDIDIIGYDGIEIGKYMVPSLTTINQPIEEITLKATRTLLELIESDEKDKKDLTSYTRILPHQIRRGTSCSK